MGGFVQVIPLIRSIFFVPDIGEGSDDMPEEWYIRTKHGGQRKVTQSECEGLHYLGHIIQSNTCKHYYK